MYWHMPIEPNQMVTAQLVENRIKFEYCNLDRAIAYLKAQYTVDTVELKIVQPRSGILTNSSHFLPSMKLDDQKHRSSEN